jgi:hypothetical protein
MQVFAGKLIVNQHKMAVDKNVENLSIKNKNKT